MDPKQFGQFISAERAAKRLTQKELAEKLGVTDKAISKWERGVCLPDVAKFDDIAAALDLTDIEVLRAHRIPPESADANEPEKAPPLFDCALVLAALVAAAVLFVGDQPWFLWEAPDRLFGLTEWDDAAEAFLSSLWYQRYRGGEWTPKLLLYIYLKYEVFDFPGLIGLLQCLAAYPIAKLLRIRHNQKKKKSF